MKETSVYIVHFWFESFQTERLEGKQLQNNKKALKLGIFCIIK
jgi:hypothetical protein